MLTVVVVISGVLATAGGWRLFVRLKSQRLEPTTLLIFILFFGSVLPQLAAKLLGGVSTSESAIFGTVVVRAPWVRTLELGGIGVSILVCIVFACYSFLKPKRSLFSTQDLVLTVLLLGIFLTAVLGGVLTGTKIVTSRNAAMLAILVIAVLIEAPSRRALLLAGGTCSSFVVGASALVYLSDVAQGSRSCRLDKCGFFGDLFTGIYPNENSLAMILVATAALLVGCVAYDKGAILSFLGSVLVVFASGARSSLIALAALVVGVLIILVFRKVYAIILLRTIALAGFAAQVLVLFLANPGSLTGRPELWAYVESAINADYVFGLGGNSLERLFNLDGGVEGTSVYSAHNQFLDVILGAGVIGLTLWVIGLVLLLFNRSFTSLILLLNLCSLAWLGVLERSFSIFYYDWMAWPALLLVLLIRTSIRNRENVQGARNGYLIRFRNEGLSYQ